MPSKPSAVIDTRVIYCGEQRDVASIFDLLDGCVELHRVLKKTGSFF